MSDENGPDESRAAPAGPVPDLGFFARSTPASSSFAGSTPASSSSGGASQFGGPPPAPAAPSRFGTAPHLDAPPVSPFGPPAPGALAGAPVYPTAPKAAPQRSDAARIARRIAAPIVVLVVLGALGVGRLSGLLGFLAGDLELPATVQGMPRSTEAVYAGVEREVEAQLEADNSGDAVVGTYADSAGGVLFVVAQRTDVDIDTTFAATGGASSARSVGESTCATMPEGPTLCIRTSRTKSIGVLGLEDRTAAAAVDEVWEAQ